MTSAFDLRTSVGWFRLIALAEAVSWVGLLVGMYFKYLGSPRTEIGVKVFGMAHGLIFIAFVVTGLLVGIAFKWGVRTWLLALLASIVPLCSVIFLIWADRTGSLGIASVPTRSCDRADRYRKRRDRLGDVTRPRPPAGPSIAGAVDLSGLKQRATAASDGGPSGPGCRRTRRRRDHRGQLRSRGVGPVQPDAGGRRCCGHRAATQACNWARCWQAWPPADAGKWALATVNVDTTPRVAQVFGVQAVPTVVALAAGQPLSSFQGMQPPEQLRGWVDSLLNATAGKLGGTARSPNSRSRSTPNWPRPATHLDAGDFDAAQTAYQAILDADPNHAEAKGAVRQIAFLARATAQRPDAVAIADAALRRHRGRLRRSRRRDPAARTSPRRSTG